jgi:hypothetical protein
MDLQPLFDAPILEQRYLDRDYDGFGNDVWVVRTAVENTVVRVAAYDTAGGPFWDGVERLFGIDYSNVERLRAIDDAIREAGAFRSPRVLRTGTIEGRACAVVELLAGLRVNCFADVSDVAAQSFGRALALGHRRRFDVCGSPGATLHYPLAEFHARAADTMDWLAREFREDPGDRRIAAEQAAALRALPPPASAALVLVDTGGSQYLWSDDGPAAVVDTEVFAYAPRELELIVMESDNGEAFCAPMRRGYESVAPLPHLAPYRDAYRCLIALLEVNGDEPLTDALAAPVWFSN